jgi:hypothetical protein
MKETRIQMLAAGLLLAALMTWAPGFLTARRAEPALHTLNVSQAPASTASLAHPPPTSGRRAASTWAVSETQDLAAALEETLAQARRACPAREALDLEDLARTWKER